MAAITWRNVNGGSSGSNTNGAASMFELAQRSTDSAFANFNKVISDQERKDDRNWDQTKTNNTDAFKNMLASAKSPEELAALVDSGQLDASQYGAQIDQNVVRDGADQRKGFLQDAFIKQTEFEDKERIVRDTPFLSKIKSTITGLDFNDPASLAIAQSSIADGVSGGMSEQSAIELNQLLTNESRGDQTFDLSVKQKNASINASQISAASSSQRMSQDKVEYGQRQDAYNKDQAGIKLMEEGNRVAQITAHALASQHLGSNEVPLDQRAQQRAALMDGIIKSGGNSQQAEAIGANFDKVLQSTHGLDEASIAKVNQEMQPRRDVDVATLDNMERQFKQEQDNNPFVVTEVHNPEVTSKELIDKHNKGNSWRNGDGGWNGSEYTDLVKTSTSVLSKGIDVTGPGGKIENFVVTKGMLDLALKEVNDSWANSTNESKGLYEALERMVTADGHEERMRHAKELPVRYAQSRTAINAETSKVESNFIEQLRKARSPTR